MSTFEEIAREVEDNTPTPPEPMPFASQCLLMFFVLGAFGLVCAAAALFAKALE